MEAKTNFLLFFGNKDSPLSPVRKGTCKVWIHGNFAVVGSSVVPNSPSSPTRSFGPDINSNPWPHPPTLQSSKNKPHQQTRVFHWKASFVIGSIFLRCVLCTRGIKQTTTKCVASVSLYGHSKSHASQSQSQWVTMFQVENNIHFSSTIRSLSSER